MSGEVFPAEAVQASIAEPEQCGRRRKGVRCERLGDVGVDTEKGDTLWLCAEHLAELLRGQP